MRSLQGRLLIATPRLADPNFARTVLLLFEHGEGGAAGVVLNRPSEATVADVAAQVLEEPTDWPKAIHVGGPVPGPLVALHAEGDLGDKEVIPGVYLTLDAAKVRDLVRRRVEPSILLANYAGWGPGQLEGELDEESWLLLPATAPLVFGHDDDGYWQSSLKAAGRSRLADLLGLDAVPDDPTLN